jgi:hypothetical protein
VLALLGLLSVIVGGYVLYRRTQAKIDDARTEIETIIPTPPDSSGDEGGAVDDDENGNTAVGDTVVHEPPDDQPPADEPPLTGTGGESSGASSEPPGPTTEEGGAKVLHRFLKAMGKGDTDQMQRLMAHNGVFPYDIELLGQGDAWTVEYKIVEQDRINDEKYTYVVEDHMMDAEGIEFMDIWHFTLEYASDYWVITEITIEHP